MSCYVYTEFYAERVGNTWPNFEPKTVWILVRNFLRCLDSIPLLLSTVNNIHLFIWSCALQGFHFIIMSSSHAVYINLYCSHNSWRRALCTLKTRRVMYTLLLPMQQHFTWEMQAMYHLGNSDSITLALISSMYNKHSIWYTDGLWYGKLLM